MRCWIFPTFIKNTFKKKFFWGQQACGINNFTFLTFTLPHYGVGQKRNWVEAALRRPSSAVTVLGRPSPEKLLRVFYWPKLWVCQGGRAWEAFSAWAIRRDVTSRRREIRWCTLQGGVGGGLTAPTWKQTRTRLGSVFFFSSLFSPSNTERFSTRPDLIWRRRR